MIRPYFPYATALLALLASCKPEAPLSDAYGNFEAREIMVAAEAGGRLLYFPVEEGLRLEAGALTALVDTVPLHLQRLHLQASMAALRQKTQDANPQISVFEEQRRSLLREIARIDALLKSNAATPKQRDDLSSQVEVLDKQIAAARSQEKTANRGILAELGPIEARLQQVEDQIARCYVYAPATGTVLAKMAEPSEITAPGKPLYQLADLDTMTLRAYFSGDQIPHLHLGQSVEVLIDEDQSSNRTLQGRISWVSDQAEFTPKTIQTKNERVNLVYAVKIRVKNDGSLKIGMPGEVRLTR
jgi:HlyD family secretion protein